MKRILLCIAVLGTALASTGCLCNPCGGGMRGPIGGCGLGQPVGVSYNECVGPAARTDDCGGCDPCTPMGGCGTFGGQFMVSDGYCGDFPCLMKCASGVGTTIHGLGQIGAGIICVPIRLVGGIFTLGTCGTYSGCGCSCEAYYGDNCAAGMTCDPCGCGGYGNGCGNGYHPGCQKCAHGYTEGIQVAPDSLPAGSTPPPAPSVSTDQGAVVPPPRALHQVSYQQQIPSQKWVPATQQQYQQQRGTYRR